MAVNYDTPYSSLERDGYKTCVCNEVLGMDDPNCEQVDTEGPTPEPTPEPQPEPLNPLAELLRLIKEIKNRPHYSEDEPSHTTWQVDELLDYIEEQLWIIEVSFIEHGLMQ